MPAAEVKDSLASHVTQPGECWAYPRFMIEIFVWGKTQPGWVILPALPAMSSLLIMEYLLVLEPLTGWFSHFLMGS